MKSALAETDEIFELVVAEAVIEPLLKRPPLKTVSALVDAPTMLNVVTLESAFDDAPVIVPRLRKELPGSVASSNTPITRGDVGEEFPIVGLIRTVGAAPTVEMIPRAVVVSELVLGPAL